MFVPAPEAAGLINSTKTIDFGPHFLGIVMSNRGLTEYVLYVYYFNLGHICNTFRKNIDNKKLLQVFNEKQNQGITNGSSLWSVTWGNEPLYNPEGNTLTWTVDYDRTGLEKQFDRNMRTEITVTLGREGAILVMAMGDIEEVKQNKKYFNELINSLEWNKKEKYEDYIKGVDKDSLSDLTSFLLWS
jgi:uncharacterized membrane-anchored protein